MLSMMMLDDHDAVCCMIMFGVWVLWSMLSMMMLDDHDGVLGGRAKLKKYLFSMPMASLGKKKNM